MSEIEKINILTLDEFQDTYLNSNQDLSDKINIGILFDSNNKKHLIAAPDIHFVFDEQNYNQVNLSPKYLVGYQYFNGSFYTIVDINKFNNSDVNNNNNKKCKTIIYLNNYKIGLLVHDIYLININRLKESEYTKEDIPTYISNVFENNNNDNKNDKFYLVDVNKLYNHL